MMTSAKTVARALRSPPLFRELTAAIAILSALVLRPSQAHAAAAGGGAGLPWEAPLTLVQTSMSGPVAYAISIIAIVAAGATLVWGGEISEFTRRIIFVVLVIALIALSTTVYTSLFTAGAVLG